MKNLFFVLTFMLIGTSFATNEVEKESTFDVEETIELSTNSVEIADADFTIEVEVNGTSFLDASNTTVYPCRWRVCVTRGGVRTCGEWTYGECLDEVIIIAKK